MILSNHSLSDFGLFLITILTSNSSFWLHCRCIQSKENMTLFPNRHPTWDIVPYIITSKRQFYLSQDMTIMHIGESVMGPSSPVIVNSSFSKCWKHTSQMISIITLGHPFQVHGQRPATLVELFISPPAKHSEYFPWEWRSFSLPSIYSKD